MVMDMIRSAVGSKEEYFNREGQPPAYFEDGQVTKLPPITEKDDGKPRQVNR